MKFVSLCFSIWVTKLQTSDCLFLVGLSSCPDRSLCLFQDNVIEDLQAKDVWLSTLKNTESWAGSASAKLSHSPLQVGKCRVKISQQWKCPASYTKKKKYWQGHIRADIQLTAFLFLGQCFKAQCVTFTRINWFEMNTKYTLKEVCWISVPLWSSGKQYNSSPSGVIWVDYKNWHNFFFLFSDVWLHLAV